MGNTSINGSVIVSSTSAPGSPTTTRVLSENMFENNIPDPSEAFEEAAETGFLDLSSRSPKLSAFPPSKYFEPIITNITKIDVSSNRLASIPAALTSLKNLKAVNFSDNLLTGIISASSPVFHLLYLEDLNLSGNNLTGWPLDNRIPNNSWKHLKWLRITQNRFRKLPENFTLTQLPSLEFLDINTNYFNLSKLPKYLFPILSNYNDQKIPSEIIKNLWLGSMSSALEKTELKKKNIKFILSVIDDQPDPPYPNDFTYKIVAIHDMPHVNILVHFPEIYSFIEGALSQKAGVLIHCSAGISRSVTSVLAYIMLAQKLTFRQAMKVVQGRRPCVRPNDGFNIQLMAWALIHNLGLDPKDKDRFHTNGIKYLEKLVKKDDHNCDEKGWDDDDDDDFPEDEGWIVPDDDGDEGWIVPDENDDSGWIVSEQVSSKDRENGNTTTTSASSSSTKYVKDEVSENKSEGAWTKAVVRATGEDDSITELLNALLGKGKAEMEKSDIVLVDTKSSTTTAKQFKPKTKSKSKK